MESICEYWTTLQTLATANSDWLIKQQNKLVEYTKLAISVSLLRVVKHFPAERKIKSMFTVR